MVDFGVIFAIGNSNNVRIQVAWKSDEGGRLRLLLGMG